MTGKALLAKLLGSVAATSSAAAVASGTPGLSAEEQTAGTVELERLVEAAQLEGRNEGVAEGRRLERERFGAVLTSDEANEPGRIGLAITLLSTTDNTPEQISTALKASPAAAELVAVTPAPGGGAPAGQRGAADPLNRGAAADSIAAETPLVDTGAPAGSEQSASGLDDKAVDALWAGALSSINPAGVAAGGPWEGVFDKSGQGRAN